MIIASIEVKGFRCTKHAKMDCSNLTAIIGRNGAGKSTFLHALDIFYDISAQITEEDFFDRNIEKMIEIQVTYSHLRKDEQEEFKHYIQNNQLIVTKRISYENGKFLQHYYGVSLQIPQFVDIRRLSNKRERVNAWNELFDKGELSNLPQKARGADQVEAMMTEYEHLHPELTKPIEREEQFFGAKSVGGGKLDKYTRFVLIPAVKEASEETAGKRGVVQQLIDMIVLRKVNSRKDIIAFKTEFEEKVKTLYSSDNLTELPELGNSISKTLEKFSPGSKLMLRWNEITPPIIQLPTPLATLVEDEFEGAISKKGHGLQRALILTLLQHLAVITPVKPEVGSEDEQSKQEKNLMDVSTPLQNPDLILAIEEPELYLHPSRSRYLSELLLNLASSQDRAENTNHNQIIYATHSPYFVDLHRFDQIRVMRKVDSPDSKARQGIVTRFSLQEAALALAQITNLEPSRFTPNSFKARSLPIMNIIANEGFFADVVVVVEGMSEIGLGFSGKYKSY